MFLSVFVYGATGAGKTHTMLGSPNNPGLTYRTVLALYERLKAIENENTVSCEVAVSYLEIYNETVIDLMNPGEKIRKICYREVHFNELKNCRFQREEN